VGYFEWGNVRTSIHLWEDVQGKDSRLRMPLKASFAAQMEPRDIETCSPSLALCHAMMIVRINGFSTVGAGPFWLCLFGRHEEPFLHQKNRLRKRRARRAHHVSLLVPPLGRFAVLHV